MWAPIATFFFTSPALFILLNIVIVVIVFISRLSSSSSSSSHTNYSDQNHNNNNNNHHHVTPLARALDRVKSNLDFSFSNYNFTPSNHARTEFYNHPQIVPPPSLIQRLKSINFSFQNFSDHHRPEEDVVSVSAHPGEPDYHPPQPAQLPRAPSNILERVKSIDFTSFYNRLDSGRVNPASSSEAEQPQSRGSDPVQLKTSKSDQGKVMQRKVNKGKMKKSASELFRRDDHEGKEELERRRPATVKAEKKSETGDVDAKADDFINRFKQQLKLQRLDSLLQYKEMLNPK